MKLFNLETLKDDDEIVTRDGRSVRIICTNRKSSRNYPIIGLINEGTDEQLYAFRPDGRATGLAKHRSDLFIKPKKTFKYYLIYKSRSENINTSKCFDSEEDLDKWIKFIHLSESNILGRRSIEIEE